MNYQSFIEMWEKNQNHQRRVKDFHSNVRKIRISQTRPEKIRETGGGYGYREWRSPEQLKKYREEHPTYQERFWRQEDILKQKFITNKKMKYIAAKHIWRWWKGYRDST